MIGPLLSVAAAALAQLPQPQFSSSHGWGVVTKANMSEPGPTVQNEIGKAASSEAKLIWAQLFLTTDEGITFNVAIRGCAPGMTDFRQNVTMPRKGGLAAEIAAIRAQSEAMFNVLEERCSLSPSAGSEFMGGFEAAYEQIFPSFRSN